MKLTTLKQLSKTNQLRHIFCFNEKLITSNYTKAVTCTRLVSIFHIHMYKLYDAFNVQQLNEHPISAI